MEYSENRQNKKAVLFDLDHTLWDHEKAQRSAVDSLCIKHELDSHLFYRYYPLEPFTYKKGRWINRN
jgi:FMN phosphatase YigB (HAD superfamily)